MTKTELPPTNAAPLWKRSWFRRIILVGALPALGMAWWLGSPLFLDRTVDEAFPAAPVATEPTTAPPADQATEFAPETASDPSGQPEPDLTPNTTVAGGPVVLASGTFSGFDAAHDGSGAATLYDVAGDVVLRFEDFEVTNGPDLRVNLVLADGSMVDLGELSGNIGNQNYDVPADLDLGSVESVLIYCRAFSVPFAEAVLS